MRIKKYVARSMPEAMSEIRKELGADAVILNSKEIKTGGVLGLFQKKSIEVVAALDKDPPVRKHIQKEVRKDEIKPRSHFPQLKDTTESREVLDEIKHLKQLIATQSFQSENDYPPIFENMYKYLLEQEMDEQIARDIITATLKDVDVTNEVTQNQLRLLIQKEIESRLDQVSFEGISPKKQIIQFVGPTGVGKTTTLAKVAALCMLEQKKEIAFITTDTYRIAAIEQLKTYARILDVPVEVAYNVQDYKNALEKFAHYEYIFVDTAGRNFRDDKYIEELRSMIVFEAYKVETYLVLSLTAKAQDVTDIYEQFKRLPIEKVVFTKMDETLTYGSILNISVANQVNVAYLTNVQDVPDDLVQPNKQLISDLIMRRYANA